MGYKGMHALWRPFGGGCKFSGCLELRAFPLAPGEKKKTGQKAGGRCRRDKSSKGGRSLVIV